MKGSVSPPITGTRPVEREVRERRLRAPAARHVQVVDELLHALEHFGVGQVVLPDEGREIRVEARERLGARPLVLHRAEEVDDLARSGRKVLRRRGLDLAGHAVEALVEERPQRPARAVAREHVKVVDVQVGLAVRAAHLGRIDEVEPVVGHHLAGDVQDEAAERIALVGVRVDAPVDLVEVFVDGAFDVDPALLGVASLRAGLAVDDVGAERLEAARLEERMLDGVLNKFDAQRRLLIQTRQHVRADEIKGLGLAELARRLTGARDGAHNLRDVEGLHAAVSLDDVLAGEPFTNLHLLLHRIAAREHPTSVG